MGLLFDILKILSGSETHDNERKRTQEKLFMDECKDLGLTKEEIEDCRQSGISPEEWLEEDEASYYK